MLWSLREIRPFFQFPMVLGFLDHLQIFLQLYLIELLGLLTVLGLLELQLLTYARLLTGFGMMVFFTNLSITEIQVRYLDLLLLFSVIDSLECIWSESPDPFGSPPVIEVSSRSPESRNNLSNFQNVDKFLFICFTDITGFPCWFFSKVTRKTAGSKDLRGAVLIQIATLSSCELLRGWVGWRKVFLSL